MKLVIASTTIRGDSGYRDYDKLAVRSPFDKVSFVITADLKSPSFDDQGFECDLEYLGVKRQRTYHCSEAIGWNKFARRNIALLRAIELEPDYILFVDDDNRPPEDYFYNWYTVLTTPTQEEVVGEPQDGFIWHNYLRTCDTDIEICPRGLPIVFRGRNYNTQIKLTEPIWPEDIGLYQGISLGDPDIDAITRIVYPKPTPVQRIEEDNFCLRNVWSPYNTQNTLIAKKLFPLAFTWPHTGRFEDIYGSFVWQQFLFNNQMYVHVGEAMNYQVRGQRNNFKDLSLEIEGYMHAHEVWEAITQIKATDPIRFMQELAASDNAIIAREKDYIEAHLRDLHEIGY